MCPPASHLTSAEERELRVLIMDAIRDAALMGKSQSLFHRIHIQAWRLSSQAYDAQPSGYSTGVPIELLITRNREVMSHEFGSIFAI